jgi:hypothetical protein
MIRCEPHPRACRQLITVAARRAPALVIAAHTVAASIGPMTQKLRASRNLDFNHTCRQPGGATATLLGVLGVREGADRLSNASRR